MRRRMLTATLFLSLVAATALAAAVLETRRVRAELDGYQEVPAVSSPGHGDFRGEIAPDDATIDYELRYAGLAGEVAQSHVHFGQPGVNGGVVLFVCTNLGNGPPGTPLCPPAPATVAGTWTAAEVVGGAAAQGIAPGELDEVLRAVRNGVAYVNLHTDLFPGGEIRGRLRPFRAGEAPAAP